MNQQFDKSLIFNDKNIVFKRINGVYWITVKSVCEALNVDYIRQFKNLQDDDILGARLSKQTIMVPGDSQPRKFICIPEEFVYGWIFSIRSDSQELKIYKLECYHLLYQHFHGTITRKAELYKEIARSKRITAQLELKLKNNPDFVEWENQKMKSVRLWKNVRTTTDEESELFQEEDF